MTRARRTTTRRATARKTPAKRSPARKTVAPRKLPIGDPVDPLPSGRMPDGRALFGRSVTLVPVSAAHHGRDMFDCFTGTDPKCEIWTYMPYGPFADYGAFEELLGLCEASKDPLFFALVPREGGKAQGMASFMRMTPDHGVLEIGHIWMAPPLQRTRAATEAIYLMMRHALGELGARRLEWKCDALNAASRKAADRFGFKFEGIFEQHLVVKGRNRDTAWFAMLDRDWPVLHKAYAAWLDDENFDADGKQKQQLSEFMKANGPN